MVEPDRTLACYRCGHEDYTKTYRTMFITPGDRAPQAKAHVRRATWRMKYVLRDGTRGVVKIEYIKDSQDLKVPVANIITVEGWPSSWDAGYTGKWEGKSVNRVRRVFNQATGLRLVGLREALQDTRPASTVVV